MEEDFILPKRLNASDAELWEELKARHQAVVLLVMDCGDDLEKMHSYFHGGRYNCMGMVMAWLKAQLNL